MTFISFSFAGLLMLALMLRFTLGRQKTEKPYFLGLLACSLVFYGWHVPVYLILILSSTCIDYFVAQKIARLPDSSHRRKIYLAASLIANLGLLGFFKYYNFALDLTRQVLSALGGNTDLPESNMILPIGISFYTFQSISYTVDVYRGKIEPIRKFYSFFLYISFFPQLVAGPIVRASGFFYQLKRKRRISAKVWSEGLYLIIQGLFLKMVCSDNVGVIVDQYWPVAAGHVSSGSTLPIAMAFLFGMQVFCDFAGYSCIARGTAYLLGFRLPINFNYPFISTSFTDHWRRWHITFSQWLRDYLYIPLGGGKGSTGRICINVMVVMTLGGLWHGAAIPYVMWGVMHGVALVIERLIDGRGRRVNHALSGPQLITRLLIVQTVVFSSYLVFRSTSISQAGRMFANLFEMDFRALPEDVMLALVYALPVIVAHLRILLADRRILPPVSVREKAVTAGLMLAAIPTFYGLSADFIYFQF